MIEMLLTERDVGGHGRNLGADLLASGSNCAARCPGSVLHKASFCKPHFYDGRTACSKRGSAGDARRDSDERRRKGLHMHHVFASISRVWMKLPQVRPSPGRLRTWAQVSALERSDAVQLAIYNRVTDRVSETGESMRFSLGAMFALHVAPRRAAREYSSNRSVSGGRRLTQLSPAPRAV